MQEFNVIYMNDYYYKKDIPHISCVYMLINGIELNYIGETSNICSRISGHRAYEQRKQFDKIYYLKVKDKKKRQQIEEKLIKEFYPKWNYYNVLREMYEIPVFIENCTHR